MAEQTVTAKANGGNGNEVKYYTRYSRQPMCASDAAEVLLDRTIKKLSFLDTVLTFCDQDGDDITWPGYTMEGLSYILGDIVYEVDQARMFYYGAFHGERWNPQPGRDFDRPEEQS